jgi:hypothetical protein
MNAFDEANKAMDELCGRVSYRVDEDQLERVWAEVDTYLNLNPSERLLDLEMHITNNVMRFKPVYVPKRAAGWMW